MNIPRPWGARYARDMTAVPGIIVASDFTTMMRSVAYAVGSGGKTGALVNSTLVMG